MFERYTEKARRIIFFARYEAGQLGSPYIETEHLLLGLLREDKALTFRVPELRTAAPLIRKQVEALITVREKIPSSVDMPLSEECKRVLTYATEEAERLAHPHVGTEHLLLGLLREEKCLAARLLHERGLRLDALRLEMAQGTFSHPAGTEEDLAAAVAAAGYARSPAETLLEFVQAGVRVGIVAIPALQQLPRAGEEVVLSREGKASRFRVTAVEHGYESAAGDPPVFNLQRIVVRVEPAEQGGQA